MGGEGIKLSIEKYIDKSKHIKSKDTKKGRYPVITQDNREFIAGFANEENPIIDIPLIVFGDHSCTLRYIDFPFLEVQMVHKFYYSILI